MSTAAGLDATALRADFPILGREVNGHPLVYLDSAATSQKPQSVLDAMDAYYRETNANVHRGVYELAAEATERFEAGRRSVARLVNAPPEGTILTKNASEAINLVAWAWGVRELKPGDEILVTEMEHHSNIVPWHLVAGITGATVRFVPVTPGGELDMDAFGELLGPRTKMVVGGAREQRARHDQPGRRDHAGGPRAGRAGAGGRLAERPPHAGRRRGARLRLHGLHGPQDARPDRDRRARRQAATCSTGWSPSWAAAR